MRTLLLSVAAAFALCNLTACNTMRGIGEDMSALGRYISNSSGTSPPHNAPPNPTF